MTEIQTKYMQSAKVTYFTLGILVLAWHSFPKISNVFSVLCQCLSISNPRLIDGLTIFPKSKNHLIEIRANSNTCILKL